MHSSRAVRPYLRRVVNISNVLDASVIDRGLAEAIDALHCGVVLTNSEGSNHANGSAEHMLQTGATVQGGNGILSAKAPDTKDRPKADLSCMTRRGRRST
jgi:hypothetical protein